MSTHGLLTRGISRSPVDSGLDCMAHEVTLPTCIYLANWSQLSPGVGVHCRAKWMADSRASQVGFCAFFCAIFSSSHDNMLLSHLSHMKLCLSWWFLGEHKQRSPFAWPLIALVEMFLIAGGGWTAALVWLWFQLWFEVSNPRSVSSDNSIQECTTFNIRSLFR